MSSSSRPRQASHAPLVAAALATALITGIAPEAAALNVHAVYRTACDRELGVILKVDKRIIHLLTLDGAIKTIPRHEIVSLAYYPVSQLPLTEMPDGPSVPPLRVETLFEGKVVDLATGWPIDYSDSKIAFLLANGKDLVIERDSIWSLELIDDLDAAVGTNEDIVFAHPQTAGFCEDHVQSSARRVFAQQILNDRIVIKRELDRLATGYEEILEYVADQKFYPVPRVYKNRTALGLWVSLFSRYGASKSRSNNFTPVLVDELSLGPFRYQHLFLSGATPNPMLLHNEAQSQIYYRFKAAYFHASVFIDPNLILVGTKYGWRQEDLEDESLDDRVNEIIGIEFGFDFGPLALEIMPAAVAQSALVSGDLFDKADLNLWRLGVRYTHRLFVAELFGGISPTAESSWSSGVSFGDATWDYRYVRANFGWSPWESLGLELSTILRSLDYFLDANSFDGSYESLSWSSAVKASYRYGHRLELGGNLVFEYQSRRASFVERERRLHPKIGVFSSFSF